MTIAALPTPPGPTDSTSVFNARAFALLAALTDFVTDANALAGEVNADAAAGSVSADAASVSKDLAAASQLAAAASALAAAASAGASIWITGTTYAIGDVRWSPVTRYVYRRITAGAGATDPSADATNWALAGSTLPQLVPVAGTTQAAQTNGHYSLDNVAASTLTLPAAPVAGDVVWVTSSNGRTDNVVARNGTKIVALAEDLIIDAAYRTVSLRYINATAGWVLI